MSAEKLRNYSMELAKVIKIKNQLWYPSMIITDSKWIYISVFFILQLIPAFFIDLVLKAAGQKPL